MDKQLGRPVLVEFWDFCRVHSLRTLPYLRAWHERYAGSGLRVIGVHSPGFTPSFDEPAVRDAVTRLEIAYPVVLDQHLEVWDLYDNQGWPARYLFDQRGVLHDVHFGEGGYADTERAVQELLDLRRPLVAARRPEDEPGALVALPSDDQAGGYSGPYEAGGVSAVLGGEGTIVVNGREVAVTHPGCYTLIEHEHHTAGHLELGVPPGVTCHAVCFTPGLVA
ncbi:MAG: redoxin domain-containing protein [Actinomycetota bacterium]|nr:redoxin domain-containing protein [Actinomycetota bacterium]